MIQRLEKDNECFDGRFVTGITSCINYEERRVEGEHSTILLGLHGVRCNPCVWFIITNENAWQRLKKRYNESKSLYIYTQDWSQVPAINSSMRHSNRFWPWKITTNSIPKNRRFFFQTSTQTII